MACGTNEGCALEGTTATCKRRLCTPGAKTCRTDAEKVVTCSENGLQLDVTDDCSGKSQVCVGGTCVPIVCAAGTKFCSGKEPRVCSAKGDISTVVETCSTSLSCNAATTTCAGPRICTPNQPVCNGTVATTCNADGSGYAAGGTACSDAGKACVHGACTECWPTAYFCSGSTVRQCAAAPFRVSSGTAIRRLDLFNMTSATVYWDQIAHRLASSAQLQAAAGRVWPAPDRRSKSRVFCNEGGWITSCLAVTERFFTSR